MAVQLTRRSSGQAGIVQQAAARRIIVLPEVVHRAITAERQIITEVASRLIANREARRATAAEAAAIAHQHAVVAFRVVAEAYLVEVVVAADDVMMKF